LRLIHVDWKALLVSGGYLLSPLFFLAGFGLVTLFFPLADRAEGRALESEFFS
jgi:hypothetical protein